jgi:spermidine/putrescine transport system permease protein
VRNSFVVALFASIVSTGNRHRRGAGAEPLFVSCSQPVPGLLFLPMVMPDIVLGIALLIFFVGAASRLALPQSLSAIAPSWRAMSA